MKPVSKNSELENLGIFPRRGDHARFFYGDNLEGYFEGRAYTSGGGTGYWLNGQPVLRDLIPSIAGMTAVHEKASSAVILPHAIRHSHGDLNAEFSILHRQRAAALSIKTKKAKSTGATILFDPGAGELNVTPGTDSITIQFKKSGLIAVVTATTKIKLDGPVTINGLNGINVSAGKPANELAIYIAFAPTVSEARRKAKALVTGSGISAHVAAITTILSRSRIETGHADYDRAVAWAKLTSYFLVTEEFGKGIWAGLPWFKNNWGRDTFIALPGTLLVSGMFDDARDVILNFLRYQDKNPKSQTYGRVPNRVQSATDIIYNTADGTPWLIRELYEYLQYTGDIQLAKEVYPSIKLALEGAIEKFVDAEGFLTHDDADTWMDARINGNLPWSARGNRANDIQALWHNALLIGVRLAGMTGDRRSARSWDRLARKVKRNFQRRFWNRARGVLADRITKENRRDEKVRPNQLMVVSIPMIEPLLSDAQTATVVENAVRELLYPHGIASLSQRDPYFHPHHHRDEWHHFDAAYHNGTVWGWNAGFTVTAMCLAGHTGLAAKLAENLADQILHLGCRGSMSELIEAIPRKRGELTLSGTWAQAWSTSEFARNAHQDFGGCHPRLLDDQILLAPHLPDDWHDFSAVFPFGQDARLHVECTRWGDDLMMHVHATGYSRKLELCISLEHREYAFHVISPLTEREPVTVRFSGATATVNGMSMVKGNRVARRRKLKFVQPSMAARPAALRKKDFLQTIVEAGKFR